MACYRAEVVPHDPRALTFALNALAREGWEYVASMPTVAQVGSALEPQPRQVLGLLLILRNDKLPPEAGLPHPGGVVGSGNPSNGDPGENLQPKEGPWTTG